MIEINPKVLDGKRAKGFALDVHTTHSKLTGADEFGHPTFESERSPMGEAIYQLKYRSDKSKVMEIAATVCNFVIHRWKELQDIDFIIPVPPSNLSRPFQPVEEIAKIVAATLRISLSSNDLAKKYQTPQLKNLLDEDERLSILSDAFEVRSTNLEGGHVLLFDDLLGSGATLRSIIDVLYDEGKVRLVSVLVLTHKRRR